MPRGYGGGGYRIRPRPIFDENEPTFGESMSRGIGRFLADKVKQQEQTDEWENQVRDAGGEVVPQPSTMDRVRGIAGAIRRHLPGYDPLPEAEANMARHPMQIGATPDASPKEGMMVPNYTPTMEKRITELTPITSGGRGYRGPVDEADTSRHYGIADEIDRVVQKGPYGGEAIMPSALGRSQMATRADMAKEARARAAKEREMALAHRYKVEEIQAGDDYRGLSPAEWDRREEIRAGHARDLKTTPTPASGNQTLAERRQRVSELRATISGAQAIIPRTAMDRRVAMRDPAQKARIEQAERDLDAAQKELQTYTLPEDQAGGEQPTSSYNDAEKSKNANAPENVVRERAAVVKADALRKFPNASKEAVAAYVRKVMTREGWPVE